MREILTAGFLACAIMLAGEAGLAEARWSFDGSAEGWSPESQVREFRAEEGMLRFTTAGFDPYVTLRLGRGRHLRAEEVPALALRMSLSGGRLAQMFFDNGQDMAESRSVRFAVIPDGRMHTYVLPMRLNPEWRGQIRALRLDPCTEPYSEVAIDELVSTRELRPRLELSGDAPEVIVSAGAPVKLSFRAVNTGGAPARAAAMEISTRLQVTGAKRVALGAVEAGGASEEVVFEIGHSAEGPHEVVVRATGGATPAEKRVTVVCTQMDRVRARPFTVVDFSRHGSSEWSAEGARVERADRGTRLQVDGEAAVHIGKVLRESPRVLLVRSSGEAGGVVVLRLEDASGRRIDCVGRVGNAFFPLEMKPELKPPLRIVGAKLIGRGDITLHGIDADSRPQDADVVLSGPGLTRPPDRRYGYIARRGTPVRLAVRAQVGAGGRVAYEVKDESGRVAASGSADVSPRGDGGAAEIARLRLEDIRKYDLTLKSRAMNLDYRTKLHVVENEAALAARRRVRPEPLYGRVDTKPSADVPRWDFEAGGAEELLGRDYALLVSDLTPAWLYHVRASEVTFFASLPEFGLEGPSHLAVPTARGVRVFKTPVQVSARMSEPWVLCWFQGAKGWTKWDSPHLLVLQRKPQAMSAGPEGVKFRFAGEAGDLVFLPLYGYFKPPVRGNDLAEKAGRVRQRVRTWEWTRGLPREVIERCRWWARALRAVPVGCEESFSVDPAADTLTIRQRFRYHEIRDDWKTRPIRIAPVPPTFGFMVRFPGFPLQFSKRPADPDYCTPYGPYLVVKDTDSYDLVFPGILRYVNEHEAALPPDDSVPLVKKAHEFIENYMRRRFDGSPRHWVEFGDNLFVWAILADNTHSRALPYCSPETRAKALASLQTYYHTHFFGPRGWWNPRPDPAKGRAWNWYAEKIKVIDGPGIHGGIFGDSGKIGSSAMYGLWCYAHHSGDVDLIRRRWDWIRQLDANQINMDWKIVGRYANAECGEHAQPMMAFARLAYMAGDLDNYYYGCYLAVRELAEQYVKAWAVKEYFRDYQPMHRFEVIPEFSFGTHVIGEAAGWQIDGPTFFRGEKQSENRWVRFHSEDVGRFFRDALDEPTRWELGVYLKDHPGMRYPRLAGDAAQGTTSLFRSWAQVFNPAHEELARLHPVENWDWDANSAGSLAAMLAAVRSGRPREYRRLVPRDLPKSPFVPGIERIPVTCSWRGLVHFDTAWNMPFPMSGWYAWGRELRPNFKNRWPFGMLVPNRRPVGRRSVQVDWTTKVTIVDLR